MDRSCLRMVGGGNLYETERPERGFLFSYCFHLILEKWMKDVVCWCEIRCNFFCLLFIPKIHTLSRLQRSRTHERTSLWFTVVCASTDNSRPKRQRCGTRMNRLLKHMWADVCIKIVVFRCCQNNYAVHMGYHLHRTVDAFESNSTTKRSTGVSKPNSALLCSTSTPRLVAPITHTHTL